MLAEVLLARSLCSGSNKCKRYSVQLNALTWPGQGRICQGLSSCRPLNHCCDPSTHGAGTSHREPRTAKQPQEAGWEKWSFPHNNASGESWRRFAVRAWSCLCCHEKDLAGRSRGMSTGTVHEQGSWQTQEKGQGPDHYHRLVLEPWAATLRDIK